MTIERETPDTALVPQTTGLSEERAVAFFGVWMMTGLFIDGWAHQAQKPETFFSPWHGILYSGFVSAVCWFAWKGYRAGRGINPAGGLDRLTAVGFLLFGAAGIADGLWHEIFGVEVDLEALVSPSHLALFFGGFLMVTSPLRLASARRTSHVPARVTWREWFPQAITLTLATALIGFFTLYLSPFDGLAVGAIEAAPVRELEEVVGIASVLAFNLLLLGALLFALRRWTPPLGFGVVLFGGVAFAMSGLDGFRHAALMLPALLAGLTADALIRRRSTAAVALAASAFVLWAGYFGVTHLAYGLPWTVELWTGSIVLAVATGLLLAAITPAALPAAGVANHECSETS